MSGFLGRLASRVIAPALSASVAPALQPLSVPSAFGTDPDVALGFVEEHVERVASPRVSAAAQSPIPPDSSARPRADRPMSQSPEAGSVGDVEPSPSRPASQPLIDRPGGTRDDATALVDIEPVLPEPVLSAAEDRPEPAEPTVATHDEPAIMESAEIEAPVLSARAPVIERVIEVHEVPGPVVPVVRPVTLPAAETRGPVAMQRSTFTSTTVAESEPTVVFVSGEPLARMGVDPLQPDDILSRSEVADVIRPDNTVHVHIGRLEIARPTPPPPMPSPARPGPNLLSLDGYLAERDAAAAVGGGRR